MDWGTLAREVTQLGVFMSSYNAFIRKVVDGSLGAGEIRVGAQKRFCVYALSERLRVSLEKSRHTLPDLDVGEVPDYESLRETGTIADSCRLMQRLSKEIHTKLFDPLELDSEKAVISLRYMNALEALVQRRATEISGTSDPLGLAIAKLPESLREDDSLHVAILRQLNRSPTTLTAGQIFLELQEFRTCDQNTVQRYLIDMKHFKCVEKAAPRKGYGLPGVHNSV